MLAVLAGCASVPMPGYISRVDHPYQREFYAGFEKVTSAVMYVLKKKGWSIAEESEPSIYERDVRYDNNGYQNLLILTTQRRSNHILTSTFTHLNVFIHSAGNSCAVEIRYEARTPLIKQWTSVRNDHLVEGLLDAVEQEINRG
jgi:hypothetical protein